MQFLFASLQLSAESGSFPTALAYAYESRKKAINGKYKPLKCILYTILPGYCKSNPYFQGGAKAPGFWYSIRKPGVA